MGISYATVAENNLIDEDVLQYIPEKCNVCGSEVEFTESLKQIYCSNSRCALKVAARLENMAKAMNVDGWGESACLEICKQYNMVSPYQIFVIGEKGLGCDAIAAFDKKIAEICDIEKRKVQLWEMVKLAGIPSIETTAYKLFNGFKSIEEAYSEIESKEVAFVAERLGISADSGVMAHRVYELLIEYKDELLFGETEFDIVVPEGDEIQVAITGGVRGFSNKQEFIRYMNSRYAGHINMVLMNTVTNATDILIADGDTSSSKYKKACKLQEKGKDIIITESSELIEMFDERYSIV